VEVGKYMVRPHDLPDVHMKREMQYCIHSMSI
jgi:hypothetical protein